MKSKPKIYPQLWYAKSAEQATALYVSIFPDSWIDHVTTLPVGAPSGRAPSAKIVDFTLFGQRFQAVTAGPHHDFNDAISIVVSCDSQHEIDRYWKALAAGGGKELGAGWLIDRFGVRWQIVPAMIDELMHCDDVDANVRMGLAMLRMNKIDIASLKTAFEGALESSG